MKTNTPFSISVHSCTWEDHDAKSDALIKKILERESSEQGAVRSNLGGFQTQPDLGNDILFNPLLTFIAQSSDTVLQSMNIKYTNILVDAAWANVNRGQGSHNQVHIHDGILSGVYYLRADRGAGRLNLINPGMNTLWQGHQKSSQFNENTAEAAHVIPRAGELYLWPSFVPHSVDVNSDPDCTRISISFNINVN
jgi:uncharacterized protein (TIGR02466 family)